MDALATLRLLIEWGADEALDDAPQDRLAAPPAAALPPPTVLPHGASSPAWSSPPLPSPALRAPEPAGHRLPAGAPAAAPRLGAAARAQALAAAAATLDALRVAIAGFDGCALAATATHLVFAEGVPGGLALVGEVPAEAEDSQGRPFAGPALLLLDRMLRSVGLDRRTALLLPAIPWRPPGGRPPTEAELAICAPFLHRALALAAPAAIVTLGQTPLRLITGEKTTLRKLHGRWGEASIEGLAAPVPMLPTFHPVAVQRQPPCRKDAWSDWLALRRKIDPTTLSREQLVQPG